MRSGAAATAAVVVGRTEAQGFMEVVEAFAAVRREDLAAARVALAAAAAVAARLAVVPIVAHQVTAMAQGDLSPGLRIAEACTAAVTAVGVTARIEARIEDRHFPAAGILEMPARVHVMRVAAWPMASGVPLRDREDLQGSLAHEVPRMARPRAFATRALP